MIRLTPNYNPMRLTRLPDLRPAAIVEFRGPNAYRNAWVESQSQRRYGLLYAYVGRVNAELVRMTAYEVTPNAR